MKIGVSESVINTITRVQLATLLVGVSILAYTFFFSDNALNIDNGFHFFHLFSIAFVPYVVFHIQKTRQRAAAICTEVLDDRLIISEAVFSVELAYSNIQEVKDNRLGVALVLKDRDAFLANIDPVFAETRELKVFLRKNYRRGEFDLLIDIFRLGIPKEELMTVLKDKISRLSMAPDSE